MSSYVFSVQSPKGFESTVQAVTDALRQEGFGVLTTIDVQATPRPSAAWSTART